MSQLYLATDCEYCNGNGHATLQFARLEDARWRYSCERHMAFTMLKGDERYFNSEFAKRVRFRKTPDLGLSGKAQPRRTYRNTKFNVAVEIRGTMGALQNSYRLHLPGGTTYQVFQSASKPCGGSY